MQTREQKYAAQVFDQVSTLTVRNKAFITRYGAMAHKLPVLIRTAGLAQALVFTDSRARGEEEKEKETDKIKPAHLLLDHLASVVDRGNRGQLLAASRTAELPEYMRLTQQVLAALLWYKRFAQSVLGVEASDEGEEPR